MTDKGSNLCTPVKESEKSKVVQNKEIFDEIEGQSEVVTTDEVHCSVCERIPPERMLVYQREMAEKAERMLRHVYEKWKAEAHNARGQLKTDIPESQLASLIDTLENETDNVMNAYIKVRSYATPPTDTRRRIDTCDGVTKYILKIAYERISGMDGDFDSGEVRRRLRELLDQDYARTVCGSTVSHTRSKSSTPISQSSLDSILMAKRIEAAAKLATKEAEFAAMMEEKEQRESYNF